MRGKVFLISCLLVFLVLVSQPVGAVSNMLDNGGFEDGWRSWHASPNTATKIDVISGTYQGIPPIGEKMLRFETWTLENPNIGAVYQQVDAVKGCRYKALAIGSVIQSDANWGYATLAIDPYGGIGIPSINSGYTIPVQPADYNTPLSLITERVAQADKISVLLRSELYRMKWLGLGYGRSASTIDDVWLYPISGVVEGTVKLNGNPVAGADVYVDGAKLATTDSSGYYRIDDIKGERSFECNYGGQIGSETLSVRNGEINTLDLHLGNPTSVRGWVRADSTSGAPIASATVTLARSDGSWSGTDRTDGSGVFRFGGLTPGTYRLRAEKPGYGSGSLPDFQLNFGDKLEKTVVISSIFNPVLGSVVWDVKDPLIDSQLTTGQVFYMGRKYKVHATLINQGNLPGQVQLKYTFSPEHLTAIPAPDKNPLTPAPLSLNPWQTLQAPAVVFQPKWEWIPKKTYVHFAADVAVTVGTAGIAGKVKHFTYFHDSLKNYKRLKKAEEIVKYIGAVKHAIDLTELDAGYGGVAKDFTVILSAEAGADIKGSPRTGQVYVVVDPHKLWALTGSYVAGLTAGVSTKFAFATGQWWLGAVEGVCLYGSFYLYQQAWDPVPDYTIIVEPQWLTCDMLDELQGSAKWATEAGLKLAAYQKASTEAWIRYETAVEEGDTYWAVRQLQAAKKYADLGYATSSQMYDCMLSVPGLANLTMTAEQEEMVNRQLDPGDGLNHLPDVEKQILGQLGLTDEEQAAIGRIVASTPVGEGSLGEIMSDVRDLHLLVIDHLSFVADWRQDEIKNQAGMPWTTFDLDGEIGGGGWYISPVTVTLTGHGNAPLSTEYRLSEDGPWLPYTGPFAVDTECITTVQARTTSGDVTEDPPAEAIIRIDLTPPEITVNVPQQTSYTHADTITVDYDVTDNCSGVKWDKAMLKHKDSCDCSSPFIEKEIQQGDEIEMFWLGLEPPPASMWVDAEDVAGWTSHEDVHFNVIATIDSLFYCTNKCRELEWITSDGIRNSLIQKLTAAKAAYERGQKKTTENILNAYINEVEKGLTFQQINQKGYCHLVQDARYVIDHL